MNDNNNSSDKLGEVKKDAANNKVSQPQRTATAPQGTFTAPQGTSTIPQGTATAPQGTATAPQGTATAPQGTSSPSISSDVVYQGWQGAKGI